MVAQEIRLIAVGVIHQADGLAEVDRTGVGEVAARRIAVAQRAEQEGGVHLRGAGVLRLEGRCGRAGGQAVIIQVLHIGLLPVVQIGERRGIVQLLRLCLCPQQTHEHGRRLCAGRRAVQLVAVSGSLEQPEIAQAVGAVIIAGRPRGHRKARHCKNTGKHHSQFSFHPKTSFCGKSRVICYEYILTRHGT